MREAVGDRIARGMPLDYAVQPSSLRRRASSAAPGRSQAVGHRRTRRSPRPRLLDGPFAVINADDFYGASSYRLLAEPPAESREPAPLAELALVGFPLAATLSPDGAVSRALCTRGRRRLS